ncbi:hypothetical protein DID75_01505 [Candidatus Marinamargulisbacteria bacterium SCGC AG-410-N11]|nr:hypothetical protein DID75_01505 [Candidatus Marinamargulisbacteria bacterium SCGC AG-410-N11]
MIEKSLKIQGNVLSKVEMKKWRQNAFVAYQKLKIVNIKSTLIIDDNIFKSNKILTLISMKEKYPNLKVVLKTKNEDYHHTKYSPLIDELISE